MSIRTCLAANLFFFSQGIEEGSISSSFTAAQWEEWLGRNVV